MTDIQDNANTSSKKQVAKTSKSTGYKKPPVASQFPPGQSGNPAGRPLGAKNKLPAFGLEQVKSTFLAELRDDITVKAGEAEITLPVLTAILRKMTDKAIAGDMRAAHMILTMAQEIEARDKEFYEEFSLRAMVFIRLWEEELFTNKFRARQIYPPFPFDHLSVNRGTGRVEIHGLIPFDPPDRIKVDRKTGRVIHDSAEEGWNLAEVEDPIAIARWFMTIMQLPEGKRWENYLP
jgi:hypothetical protein